VNDTLLVRLKTYVYICNARPSGREPEPERLDRMLSVGPPSRTSSFTLLGIALVLLCAGVPVAAQSLQGSVASLDRQNRMARQHDYTYIDTGERVRYFASKGWLVPVRPTRNFALHAVSFPYARPEVDLFINRLSGQYRRACGEQLVVTSLTRPTTRQPRNASDRSVHPTGMALDLRYSGDRNCRKWLEGVLGDLERQGVLEATRERRPVHYHVAIFPHQYGDYVDGLISRQVAAGVTTVEYTIRSGDSLWDIARDHGTTVDELQDVNGIDGSRIFVGQVIDVPLGSS